MGKMLKGNLKGILTAFAFVTLNGVVGALTVLAPQLSHPNVTLYCSNSIPITTTLSTPISSEDGESSVSLFYRLEGDNGLGSHFWDATIFSGSISTVKTLDLPVGGYRLICYQKRKGGPIKSMELNFNVVLPSNSITPCLTKLPTHTNSNSALSLTHSWNVFTDPYFSSPHENHFAYNTTQEYTPSSPWLFITLSIREWHKSSSPITLAFNGNALQYDGYIYKNIKGSITGLGTTGINIIDDSNGNLSITRSSNFTETTNAEYQIFLIFKKKSSDLDAMTNVQFQAQIQGTQDIATITPPVKSGPHDPNSLQVDNRTLCPCQCDEWLTYQVSYQNSGKGPVTKVEVEIRNTNFFETSTVQLIQPLTYLKHGKISYDINTNTFKIAAQNNNSIYSLPGLGQTSPTYTYNETEDYFKFKIKKKNCLPTGTVIQPKACIYFFDGGSKKAPISTNLEKTTIVAVKSEIKDCPEPCKECVNKCTKKKTWPFSIFGKK